MNPKAIVKLFSTILLTCVLNAKALSQESKVWVRVTNEDILHELISDNSTRLIEWENLISLFNIKNVKQILPSSKQKKLLEVIEITCECNENDLLFALTKTNLPFVQPEHGPNFELLYTPNDYSLQFANDYALELINAKQAWDITQGDTSVVIAVSDANYYTGHEELIGKINHLSPNFNTDYTHGTAVAITAAGNTNNGVGKSSIGFKSRLQLRTMDFNELLEATYTGAKIINLSWSSSCAPISYHQDVMNEIHANGTVIVAAAGNGGTCGGATNMVYPASYDNVISVTSIGPNNNHERELGNPLSTHQHNSMVDLCAPGYDIALSTQPGAYFTSSGSSFAAPYVSGLVALMLAVNSCLTPDEIEFILKSSAVNIDALNTPYIGTIGAGRINAQAAVQMASTFNTFLMSAQNTADCGNLTQGVSLNLTLDGTPPFSVLWNNGMTNDTISGLEAGTYSVLVKDSMGCVASYQTTFEALTPITINEVITQTQCFESNNGSVLINPTGGSPPYSAIWNTGESSFTLDGISVGSYFIIVTDNNGCSNVEFYEFTQPPPLYGTIVSTNVFPLFGGALDLSVFGGEPPYSYSWSNGNTSQDQSGLPVGFYEVLVTDNRNCTTSLNASITDTPVLDSNNQVQNFANIEFIGPNKFNCYAKGGEGAIYVEWELNEPSNLEIVDGFGRQIYVATLSSTKSELVLNIPSSGAYFVRFSCPSGTLTKKVVL